jgi:hypothetical protein
MGINADTRLISKDEVYFTDSNADDCSEHLCTYLDPIVVIHGMNQYSVQPDIKTGILRIA